jgi:adenylate cyclase
MAYEIERKFLVTETSFLNDEVGVACRQGYLAVAGTTSVRVRVIGDQAYLTVKGADAGIARREFEYQIPLVDAEEMLDLLCNEPPIEKTRYKIECGSLQWDVDLFHGVNQGLHVAEIELTSEEQEFAKPPWVGEEVTGQAAYYNVNLSRHPYSQWSSR